MLSSDITKLNISLPTPLVDRLRSACHETGATISGYVGAAIRAKLNADAALEKTPDLVELMKELVELARRAEIQRESSDRQDTSA